METEVVEFTRSKDTGSRYLETPFPAVVKERIPLYLRRIRRGFGVQFRMEINVFKLCSGLKFLGYLMIFLVAGIIAISYYAVVVFTWACYAAVLTLSWPSP